MADASGGAVSCALLGSGVSDAAQELVAGGCDTVYVYDDESLAFFDALNYRQNLVALMDETKPEIALFGSTLVGKSLAPRIAAALEAGLTSNCVALELQEDGTLKQTRPAFTGTFLATVVTASVPTMATVRFRSLEAATADSSRKGEVIKKQAVDVASPIRVLGKGEPKEASIAGADIVVCAGRGLKKAEDFPMIQELADALGGVVGATRPLVDDGWISKDHQVGFSGTIVKPKLYVGCGVSGSPQHLAGMRESGMIVAINSDPSVALFRVADYAVVGDIYDIVPQMVDRLKKL